MPSGRRRRYAGPIRHRWISVTKAVGLSTPSTGARCMSVPLKVTPIFTPAATCTRNHDDDDCDKRRRVVVVVVVVVSVVVMGWGVGGRGG